MAYDFHGKWERETGHNAPLYAPSTDSEWRKQLSVDHAANMWVKMGAPKDKLVIGMPTYGRTFTLSNPEVFRVNAPASGGGKAGDYTKEGGFLAYYEVCDMLRNGASYIWDEEMKVPYAVQGDQWVGFDDERSIRNKMKWIKDGGFGGAMVWTVDMDDFTGDVCGGGVKYPLITAMRCQVPAHHRQVSHRCQVPAHHRQMSHRRQVPAHHHHEVIHRCQVPTHHRHEVSHREELRGVSRGANVKDIDWSKIANAILVEAAPKPAAIKIPVGEVLKRVRGSTHRPTALQTNVNTRVRAPQVFCYMTSWSQKRPGAGKFTPDNIDATLCTHVIYAFATLKDHKLAPGDEKDIDMYEKVVALREKNPDIQVRHSVVGDGHGLDGAVILLAQLGDQQKFQAVAVSTKSSTGDYKIKLPRPNSTSGGRKIALTLPNSISGGRKITLTLKNSLRCDPKVTMALPNSLSGDPKILLAIGGWAFGSTPFKELTSNVFRMNQFVYEAIELLREYKFNGLDVDWEYPRYKDFDVGAGEINDLVRNTHLLARLTSLTDSNPVAWARQLPSSTSIRWPNVLIHVAPKTGRDFSAREWVKQGAPKEKLMIGMPTYGRSFTLIDPTKFDIGAPASGGGVAGKYTGEAGFMSYYEVCDFLHAENTTLVWDNEQQVPFAYRKDQWVGFDDERSLKTKVNNNFHLDLAVVTCYFVSDDDNKEGMSWLKEEGFGGIMIWSVDMDDFRGHCGTGKYPLINAMRQELDGYSVKLEYDGPYESYNPNGKYTTKNRECPSGGRVRKLWSLSGLETVQFIPVSSGSVSSNEVSCEEEEGHISYHKDRADCTMYYMCEGERKHHMPCPSNLVFNPNENVCDWPENVEGCQHHTPAPPTAKRR
uniref:Chitinase n=1 Tax=Timema bartmani TaxID=61472 RepID=A0A7R9I2N8_9NEOP|nr:unnamed protein product [Timema bartmani]